MVRGRIRKKMGFTLVEVIIAMSIIMVISATFYKVQYVAIKSSDSAKQKLEGMMLAQSYIEEIKATKNINTTKPNSNKYIIDSYITTEEADGNNRLIKIVIKVNLKNSPSINVAELGTKIYLKQ